MECAPTLRQARILKRLELIGPGSIAFFRDYIRISSEPETLESYSHIVSHLLREIESSIRDVVESISPEYKKNGDNHRRSIGVCLQGLDVEPDDPIAKSWFSFIGDEGEALHKLAHRNGLQSPRGQLQSYILLWSVFEDLIDNLLTKYEAKYLVAISQLDAMIQKSSPGNKDAKKLVGKMPQHWTVQKYFLERVENPVWLDLLYEERFFANPPAKRLATTGENYELPPWPASKFLVKMASLAPVSVAQIIRSTAPVNNRNICADLVRAAFLLPDENVSTVSLSLGSWIENSDHIAIHDDYPELIAKYLDIGAMHEALIIIDRLLSVRVADATGEPDYRFEEWSLEFFLEKVLPDLGKAGDIRALDLFARLLNDSFTVGGEGDQQCWRLFRISALPAIEDHEQNQQYISHQCRLVFAVRDIALALATSHWDKVIACLHRYDDRIFARIEVYLRSRFPGLDPDGTSELLSREAILSNSEFHHERFHLLKSCFDLLSKAAKANYLRFIDDETRWAKIRENRSDIKDEEWPRFKRRLIYDRLIPIAEYLEGEWKSRYEAYRAEFGEEAHPDFEVYLEGGRVINHMPTRPLEEYADCTAEDFAKRIRELEVAPDASELANTLRDLVAARTAEFAVGAHHFSGLPLMYTRSFLGSIRDYLETRRPLEPAAWNSVLLLCKLEVQQYQKEVQSKDDYRDIYIHLRIILSILQSGIKGRSPEIPIDERDLTWEVLYPLTDHPAPSASEEDPDEDMAVSSINTVRGEAMHTVVDYALWIKRCLGEDFMGMATIPKVQEVLEKHLRKDKALTICAVYGKWYPWLEMIDPNWGKEWKYQIFPESDETRRRVAWETYVTFCPPYNGIFETLKGDYAWAVTQIGTWPERQRSMGHPDESLLEHLFAYYWRGKLPLDDPDIQLRDAYARANVEHKVEALRYVGRGLKEWVSVDPDTLERLKTLWEKVIEDDGKDKPKTLETFGLWFSSPHLDAAWSLAALQRMLGEVRPKRPDHWIIGRLGRLATDFPSETLRCVDSLYKYAESPLYLEHWWEPVITILRAALSGGNLELKAETIKLANVIGSKGLQPQNLSELRALVENA